MEKDDKNIRTFALLNVGNWITNAKTFRDILFAWMILNKKIDDPPFDTL